MLKRSNLIQSIEENIENLISHVLVKLVHNLYILETYEQYIFAQYFGSYMLHFFMLIFCVQLVSAEEQILLYLKLQ